MPYEVFFRRKPRWEDRVNVLRAATCTIIDIVDEVMEDVDDLTVCIEGAVTGEENETDFFPDISNMRMLEIPLSVVSCNQNILWDIISSTTSIQAMPIDPELSERLSPSSPIPLVTLIEKSVLQAFG